MKERKKVMQEMFENKSKHRHEEIKKQEDLDWQ